jgi:hypothetical protein
MRASAAAFDAGDEAEARRIATAIRMLVHDTKNSHSILGQLGAKEAIIYVDTAAEMNPRNILSEFSLAMVEIGLPGGARYVPYLDDLHEPAKDCDFDDWWAGLVVKDGEGTFFSRSELLLAVANKDGGAHVDPELGAEYARLSRSNSMHWIFSDGQSDTPLGDPVPASIRQIAWELDEALRRQDLIDLEG